MTDHGLCCRISQNSTLREALRAAVVQTDGARGRLGHEDPDTALANWEALLGETWSIVDWFDTDERRYIIAMRVPARANARTN